MSASVRSRNAASHPAAVSVAKLMIVGLMNLPMLRALALPLGLSSRVVILEEGTSPDDPSLWIYLGVAVALVLLGGIFAGLTIAYATLVIPPRN